MQYEPLSRKEVLTIKREITESRLTYARSVGDKKQIAVNEAQLERIAKWEREG
jgi:hypothetical protein